MQGTLHPAGRRCWKDTTVIANNPYPPESAEHAIWERWLQVFLAQPAYSQFFDAELQLRLATGALEHLSARVRDPELQRALREQLAELRTTGQLLEAAGERAFALAVAHGQGGQPGRTKDSDPAA